MEEVRVPILMLNSRLVVKAFLAIGATGAVIHSENETIALPGLTASGLATLTDSYVQQCVGDYYIFVKFVSITYNFSGRISGRMAKIFYPDDCSMMIDYGALVAAAKKVLGETTPETPTDAPATN